MSSLVKDKISPFGERLKEAFDFAANKIIGEKLKVGKSTVTSYMQGRIPPPDKLIEIAELTECNLNWLLTGVGAKRQKLQIERPQGIVLQGSKGGIGTSTCAVLLAANLSLQGHQVLLVEDELQTCSYLLFAERFLPDFSVKTRQKNFPDLQYDYLVKTNLPNLDFFIPRTCRNILFPADECRPFQSDYAEVGKKYQFVIFDVQRSENPFYYPHGKVLENYYLEPILRNAKVVVPFEVMQSFTDNVERTIEFVERQQAVYPEAEFLGLFLLEQRRITKSQRKWYDPKLKELEDLLGDKIFQAKINYHPQLDYLTADFHKILLSRKTNIFADFSALTQEIKERISLLKTLIF